MIDARSLHKWLMTRDRFADWIKHRIETYGFLEDVDYFGIVRKSGGKGRPRTDYLLTVSMAKELAMVERTDRGRICRHFPKKSNRPETLGFLRVSENRPINPHSWTEKPSPGEPHQVETSGDYLRGT